MKIKEFTEKIAEQVSTILGKNVQLKEVDKLNGAKVYGIIIFEPNSNIAPTLYMEDFYYMYMKTGNWQETLRQIIAVYESDSFPSYLDMEWFKDFDAVRGLIFHKLINYNANTALLEDVPHTRYLDFAIVYCVYYENEETGAGSILIHNNHLELWNRTTHDLARFAEENTPRLYPLTVSSMESILWDCMDIPGDCPVDAEGSLPVPLYVMSNDKRCNGAITICYKDSLKNFAMSKNSDVAILPSSLHEVILLPVNANDDFRELKDMVYEVNRSHLSKEEFLSDNIYLYRRDTDNVEIV